MPLFAVFFAVFFAACVLDRSGLREPSDSVASAASVGSGGTGPSGPVSATGSSGAGVGGSSTTSGGGCSPECALADGFFCESVMGSSECWHRQDVTVEPDEPLAIEDNNYDGTLDSMNCLTFVAGGDGIRTVTAVELRLGLEHERLGHLVVKVQSPDGTILTVLNRPGTSESKDDGNSKGAGSAANLAADYPLAFRDGAATSAEDMGKGLEDADVVCKSSPNTCEFAPAPDSDDASLEGFAGFSGEPPEGEWLVCAGDAVGMVEGTLASATLTLFSK